MRPSVAFSILIAFGALTPNAFGATAQPGGIVIDGILGQRARYVPGIQGLSQAEISRHAANLALAQEGWSLANLGGIPHEYGPPGWVGGSEWAALNVPPADSDDWGYDVPGNSISRGLIFHTDDTVSRSGHDIGEPSPFGVISGVYSIGAQRLGQREWGTFSVDNGIAPRFPLYDMPNGESGVFNYGDRYYSGFGDGSVERSPLSAGRGELLDGVVAEEHWDVVSDPYVGWTSIDPTIVFEFDDVVSIDLVRVHVDNSLDGGVSLPESIRVEMGRAELTLLVAADTNPDPRFIEIHTPGFSGDSLSLTLTRRTGWIMVSEVQLIPEPTTLTLAALALLTFTYRRPRRHRPPSSQACHVAYDNA